MANYEQLKSAISDVIKDNGNKEITGDVLQLSLLSIINTIGVNYTFSGIATPTTVPGTPDQNVFYLAGEPGIYPNFGAVSIKRGQLAFFYNEGDWKSYIIDIATTLGMPTDTANPKGNAWGQINDIKNKIGQLPALPNRVGNVLEQLQYLSPISRKTFNLTLIEALTSSSSVSDVQIAFTPENYDTPSVPDCGDYLLGKINDLDRSTQRAVVQNVSYSSDVTRRIKIVYNVGYGVTVVTINSQWQFISKKRFGLPNFEDESDVENAQLADFDGVSINPKSVAKNISTVDGGNVEAKLSDLDNRVSSQKADVDAARDEAIKEINDEVLSFNEGVTPEMLSPATVDLINASGGGTIINQPDDEDLKKETTQGGTEVMKFADKSFNSAQFSGLARKYLRKDISSGTNPLTQDMVKDKNTIYHIQYAYDLQGATINIPDGCVIVFEGGSLENGTVNFNHSQIISRGTCLKTTLTVQNLDYVESNWIGIYPNKDCSQEFKHFTQFGMTLKFRDGEYIFNSIENTLLSRGTCLLGNARNRKAVRFNITPSAEYEYLIGVNYDCSVENLSIYYTHNDSVPYGNVLQIDTSFNKVPDSSFGSEYNYKIENVYIGGHYLADGSYKINGITGIAIKCNQYDSEGQLNVAKAISWYPIINNTRIKFARIGILVEVKQDSPSGDIWCNSLNFQNIAIAAYYGIYFDRVNGKSTGWCTINNYMFQSYHPEDSYGLYGVFYFDKVSNYVSWDNKFLGYGSGVIEMSNTALSLYQSSGTVEAEGESGFVVPDGKTLTVNHIRKQKEYYTNKSFDLGSNINGVSCLDYSNRTERAWIPYNTAQNAATKVLEKYSAKKGTSDVATYFMYYSRGLYSGYIDNGNTPSYDEIISSPTGAVSKQTNTYNIINGYKYITETFAEPILSIYNMSFIDDYNTISKVISISLNSSDKNSLVELTVTASPAEGYDLTNYFMAVRRLSLFGGNVVDSYMSGDLELKILVETKSQTALKLLLDVKMLNKSSLKNEWDWVYPENINLSVSNDVKGKLIGTTDERPTEYATTGFQYFDSTLNKPIWKTDSGWVDATGASV